jgi:hypothetical protein
MDLGQGSLASASGSVAAMKSFAGWLGVCRCSTQKSPSCASSLFSAPCLRKNPASACSGALARGPRSAMVLAGSSAATSASSAMRRGP